MFSREVRNPKRPALILGVLNISLSGTESLVREFAVIERLWRSSSEYFHRDSDQSRADPGPQSVVRQSRQERELIARIDHDWTKTTDVVSEIVVGKAHRPENRCLDGRRRRHHREGSQQEREKGYPNPRPRRQRERCESEGKGDRY